MKKYGLMLLALLVCGAGFAGTTNLTNRQIRDPRQLETILDDNFAEIYAGQSVLEVTINNAIVKTNVNIGNSLTVSNATTIGGKLEVNNSDVDINMTLTNNTVRIDQTNVTGQVDTPLIKITDPRTGATANTAGEATLVIVQSGTHSIVSTNGIIKIGAEIESDEDITIDPDGNDLIIDATIDATALTIDAAAGIDTKTSGALKVGVTTATSVDYGSAIVTAHSFTSDGEGNTEIVLPGRSIGAGEIDLANTYIYVGNAGNTGVAVAVGGDVTIAADGTTTIGSAKIDYGMINTDAISNDNILATAEIASTKIAGEAVVKTTVFTGEVAGVWDTLVINPSAVTSEKINDGTITNDDIGANASIASTKILDEAVVKTTVLTGAVAGVWNSLTIVPGSIDGSTDFAAGVIGSDTVNTGMFASMGIGPGVTTSYIANIYGGALTGGGQVIEYVYNTSGLVRQQDGAGNCKFAGVLHMDTTNAVLGSNDIGGLVQSPTGSGAGLTALDAANIAAGTTASAFSGEAVTNLAGGNIASGDILSDRMTTHGVVVTDFAASGDVLIGSGAGTFAAISGKVETAVTIATTLSTNVLYFATGGILTNSSYTGP